MTLASHLVGCILPSLPAPITHLEYNWVTRCPAHPSQTVIIGVVEATAREGERLETPFKKGLPRYGYPHGLADGRLELGQHLPCPPLLRTLSSK